MDMVLDSCWIMLFPLVSEFSRVLQQIPKPVVPLFWNLGKTKKNKLFSSQQQHHHHIIISTQQHVCCFRWRRRRRESGKRLRKKRGFEMIMMDGMGCHGIGRTGSSLTSLNWIRPSSPTYVTVSCADSAGMINCTSIISSDRNRSMDLEDAIFATTPFFFFFFYFFFLSGNPKRLLPCAFPPPPPPPPLHAVGARQKQQGK